VRTLCRKATPETREIPSRAEISVLANEIASQREPATGYGDQGDPHAFPTDPEQTDSVAPGQLVNSFLNALREVGGVEGDTPSRRGGPVCDVVPDFSAAQPSTTYDALGHQQDAVPDAPHRETAAPPP
jgi:hypothetical protein